MPFSKGKSGNPLGRPKKGDSLAEAIRSRWASASRKKAIDAIARKAESGDTIAFQSLAKHGWPDEAKGEVNLSFPDATSVQVIHKHVS